MSAIDNIIEGATNAIGSGGIGLALGTIKGAIQSDQQKADAKELADYQNKLARQNALDKWSIEKSAMMKAGINMARLGGMQTMNIPADVPTPQVENTQYVPPISQGTQQMADTELKKSETEKNEEFLKNAEEYWNSKIASNWANAKASAAEELYKNALSKSVNQETDIQKAVVSAYGDLSTYGRMMKDRWELEYDALDAETREKMAQVGLTKEQMNQVRQDVINSKEFVKIARFNALTEKAYKEGIVKVENGKLQWDKERFKKEFAFEHKKWRAQYDLNVWEMDIKSAEQDVMRRYQESCIKTQEQERFWKPVTVCSQAFRDIAIGVGSLGGLNMFQAPMRKIGF